MITKCLLSFFLITFLTLGFSQSNDTSEKKVKVLTVGTKEAPPFSMKDKDGKWSGMSIELWEDIADELGVAFQYKEASLKELIQKTQDSAYDLSVAAISINREREEHMDFSQPYFVSGQGIAVRSSGSSFFAWLKAFFSIDFFKAVGALALVILVFGFFMWLAERRKNTDEFGGPATEGIGSGFWWSAVTMTTVGYGDKSPRTKAGRFIALVWMFAAIIIISGFTAAIASSLTIQRLDSRIQSVEDLKKAKVLTVEKSATVGVLNDMGISFKTAVNLEEAMTALEKGKAEAVVYDKPLLQYYLRQSDSEKIAILPSTFKVIYYAIALPENSLLKERIDRVMIEYVASGRWKAIKTKYLGTSED